MRVEYAENGAVIQILAARERGPSGLAGKQAAAGGE
jgi:hypothetical protein